MTWGWEDDTDILRVGEWVEPDLEPAPGLPPRRRRPWAPEQRRLVALVAGAVALIVILVVGISSCAAAKGSAERAYLRELASPAGTSQQIGVQLTTLLKAGRKTETDAAIIRLATSARQNLVAVEALKPPGRLEATGLHAQQALQLRAAALQAIGRLLGQRTGATSAALLAAEGRRLIASDVIWHDLVQDATQSTLVGAGITDVRVPVSRFLSDWDLVSSESLARLLASGGSGERPVLKRGDRGSAVSAWQRALNRWLAKAESTLAKLSPDGSFGQMTEAVTKELQTSAGLVPDGIVGAKTRRALEKALAR